MRRVYLSLLLTSLYFSGCAFYNPFVPHGGVIVDEGCSLPPQEPITSDAMYKATMKSYTVNGIRYQPIVPQVGDTFKGIASWYGANFHGGKTSNGEYYDMTSYTAAHKTLPMNTMLRVTNLENHRSTIVRINDRGPFVANRIIDLSEVAARDIGMIRKGTAKVKLEVLDYDTSVNRYKQYRPFPKAKESIEEISQNSNRQTITPLEKSTLQTLPIKRADNSKTPLQNHYKIQILSSTDKNRARRIAQKYATIDDRYHSGIKSKNVAGQTLYRVIIGNFDDPLKAKEFINKKGLRGAFVIKD